MIEFLYILVAVVALCIASYLAGRKHEINQLHRNIPAQNPDLTPFLEEIEPEKSSPETRVLQVIEEISEPLTYTDIAKRIPALDKGNVKTAIKSLEAKGKIEIKRAGYKGNRYEVNNMKGEE